MRRRDETFWCCALLLLVVSSCSGLSVGDSVSHNDQRNDNLMTTVTLRANNAGNSSDAGAESVRHNSSNNDARYEFQAANSTISDDDDDSVRYELHAYTTKSHEVENARAPIPMELCANSTKVRTDGESDHQPSRELCDNFTRNSTDDGDSAMEPYELRRDNPTREDDDDGRNNSNVVPYEVCDNSTCIQLCCPLGHRLIKDKCVAGKGSYPFPDVYYETTEEDATTTGSNADARLDRVFQLAVHDPCRETGRYLLNPDDYPEDEYTFFVNGTLYQPQHGEYVRSTSYCLAVVNRDRYDVTVCFENVDETVPTDDPAGIPVGLIVSLPFFLATFVVYTVLPELRNMHGYTLRGYVGSLFVAYTVLAVLQLTRPETIGDSVCIALAFIIHFSFLSSFFWLNVMCFDIWWTFGGFRSLQGSVKQRERKKFIMYSIYAWGSASSLTIVCAIMDFVPSVPKNLIRPEFGAEKCWFTTDAAKALYFYGPMSITVVCNICLFISTALKIVRHKKDTAHHLRGSESRRHDDNKQWFNLYLKLFIVMGINWSMEIVSWLFKSAPQYIWYLTDLTNTLQGLIIFIIFVWKQKIKRLLLKRFGCQDRGLFSGNSTRSGYHSSASRTCTTTSGVMPLQEKISPYVQANSRAKSSSDNAEP